VLGLGLGARRLGGAAAPDIDAMSACSSGSASGELGVELGLGFGSGVGLGSGLGLGSGVGFGSGVGVGSGSGLALG